MPRLSGLAAARQLECSGCPHRVTLSGKVYGHWTANRCVYGHDGHPKDARLLDATYLEGGQCPAGFWEKLEPLDLEAARAERHAARVKREADRLEPVLAEALESTSVTNVLERLVGAGRIDPETAVELEDRLTREERGDGA